MASVACSNVSGMKRRLRSATSVLSFAEPSPVSRVALSGEVSGMSNREAEGDLPLPGNVMDREYQTFLNNLTVYGKSYLLEIWMGNPQRLIRLKYEKEGNDEGTVYSTAIYPRTRSGSNEIADAEKLLESKKRLEPDSPTLCLSESWCFEKKHEAIDENYQYFLDNVRICGRSIILVQDNNEIIKFEEEVEEEVEAEGDQEERVQVKQELLDESEDSLKESTVSSKHSSTQDSRISAISAYRTYIETMRNRAPSFFRNKLIDVISSPFNQSEYENLIVQARKRSPQVKLKHLRSDSILYKTKKLGSSYFDYFPG